MTKSTQETINEWRIDAERYRWLRGQQPDSLFDLYMDIPENPSPEQFDAAVDHARSYEVSRP